MADATMDNSILQEDDNCSSPMIHGKRETIVNDIVHGIINLPHHILDIIDTPQFQRLRFVSQMGFTKYVYPTATNSRFEHSIGTFHLASRVIKQFQSQLANDQTGLGKQAKISNEEVKCLEIAALCHDIGHGPFSHTWEHVVIPLLGMKDCKHETMSCEIFLDIIKRRKKGETIRKRIGLDDSMVELIGRLILGKYNEKKDQKRKFLFEIVANKQSGLDVDKFDYLCRDPIYLGWSNKSKIHDIDRIIQFMRVAKNAETGEYRLAIRDREIFHIHNIFYFRHMLHRYGCRHKTVLAMECMFEDAMKRIIGDHWEDLYRSVMEDSYRGSGIIDKTQLASKEFISRCCDHHIWIMMNRYTKDIVEDIENRNLYKLYCKLQTDEVHENTPVVTFLNEMCKSEKNKNLYSFMLSRLSLQSENKGDPMLNIPFYRKNAPNSFFMFQEQELPTLVKLIEDDLILMIFAREQGKEDFDPKDSLDEEIECLREKFKFKDLKY